MRDIIKSAKLIKEKENLKKTIAEDRKNVKKFY